MRDRLQEPPAEVVTLEDALASAIARKRARGGASERTLESARTYARALLEAWEPSAPMAEVVTASELHWYIEAATKRGRSIRTVREKDLPLLKLAAAEAGVAWPTDLRAIRSPRRPMAFFEPEELVELVRRVREEPILDGRGRPKALPGRTRAADLLELVLCTGLRSGELARLAVEDIDETKRTVRVINAKDAGSVDLIPYPTSLDGPIARLLDAARANGGQLVPGGEPSLATLYARWKERLNEPRLSGRALRHSHITLALYDTGDAGAAREAGRHRSLTTTSRYVHAVESRRAKRVAALGERFAPRRSQDGE